MIRPTFRLVAGAFFLCLKANGAGEEPMWTSPASRGLSVEQSQRKVPTKAVLPDRNRTPGVTDLVPVRPEAVSRLIPVKPSDANAKTEHKSGVVALPALPPLKVPLHEELVGAEKADSIPNYRTENRPVLPTAPKREVPPLAKEVPPPKPKVPTRSGKAMLREIDDTLPPATPAPEPISPRGPAAIDPKEMAPISGGNVKMPALAIRSGVAEKPISPLQEFNAAYIRKVAIEAGVNEALATEIGGIIEQMRAGDSVVLSKAARSRSDLWLVQSCEELKHTAEAERPVAFQEMLRVHRRMRASETPGEK